MNSKVLPIIANKQYISFSWGIRGLSMLKNVVTKSGYKPLIIVDESEIDQLKDFSYAFVMGVDRSWIDNVLKLLEKVNVKGIIVNGNINDASLNFFVIHANEASVINQSVEHLIQKKKQRIALFGVQENDISDISKIDAFYEVMKTRGLKVDAGDIYEYDDDISKCFNTFSVTLVCMML